MINYLTISLFPDAIAYKTEQLSQENDDLLEIFGRLYTTPFQVLLLLSSRYLRTSKSE